MNDEPKRHGRPPKVEPHEPLAAFIARVQRDGDVVVRVEHPECAAEHVHSGPYSGFPVTPGAKPRARLASGAWIE